MVIRDPRPLEFSRRKATCVQRTPPEENARAVDAHETLELRYQWELIYKYSSLYKLLKIVSYCLRFILNILKRVRQRRLSHSELFIKALQNSNLGYNSDLMAKSVPNILSRLNKNLSILLLELSFMNIEQTFFFNRFISPIELNRSRYFIVYLLFQRKTSFAAGDGEDITKI